MASKAPDAVKDVDKNEKENMKDVARRSTYARCVGSEKTAYKCAAKIQARLTGVNQQVGLN